MSLSTSCAVTFHDDCKFHRLNSERAASVCTCDCHVVLRDDYKETIFQSLIMLFKEWTVWR
jgi:hypothetical protein